MKRVTSITATILLALAALGQAEELSSSFLYDDETAPLLETTVCTETVACRKGPYGGADFLWVEPRFSQAIAFARGTSTPTSIGTQGVELDFDPGASLRAFIGYSWGPCQESVQFTYWRLTGDVDVDGTAAGLGEFITDPFGNGVGTIIIIDPNSALFGQQLPAGDAISTRAEVTVEVYDLDVKKPFLLGHPRWEVAGSFGMRLADIEQYYESVVTLGGNLFAEGRYFADFIGAGPRVGVEATRHVGQRGLSLFATSHISLLVGEYEEFFSNTTTVPAPFEASQEVSLHRTLSTLEGELGVAWRFNDHLQISASWFVQSWLDLGTSGGKFGGFFVGTDDANIMAFDGTAIRAELTY